MTNMEIILFRARLEAYLQAAFRLMVVAALIKYLFF